MTSHESTLNYFTGEYNTYAWESLVAENYDTTKLLLIQDLTYLRMEIKLLLQIKNGNSKEKVLVHKKDNTNGYSLKAIDKGNKVEVDVDMDKNNLESYVSYNKDLVKELENSNERELAVVITFKKPLPVSEISSILDGTTFKLEEIMGRAFNPEGQRITFSGIENNLDTINLLNYEEFIKGSDFVDVELAGIFTLQGTINPKDLKELNTNENIFLVDVTANAVKEEVKQQQANKSNPIDVDVHNSFWYIEQ